MCVCVCVNKYWRVERIGLFKAIENRDQKVQLVRLSLLKIVFDVIIVLDLEVSVRTITARRIA